MSIGPHYYPTASTTTLNLQVGASTDDTNSPSNSVDTGGAGGISSGDLTNTLLSPGNHAGTDRYYAGCRFTNVTVAQGTTITSATFSLFAVAYSSPGTITFLVSCQAADNPATFGTGSTVNLSTSRIRTTANSTWNQKTTTAVYQSVDITTAVQEVINRAGWASGNAIVVIVEISNCTTGEWQDYSSWDNADTNNPKLDIIY